MQVAAAALQRKHHALAQSIFGNAVLAQGVAGGIILNSALPIADFVHCQKCSAPEHDAFFAGQQLNLHWLRAYYITGDEAHGSSIFAKIAQAELDGKTTFPFTSGQNKYDFIDLDELATMIVAASVQNKVNGIINVCTGQPRTLADRVEQFLRDKNYKIKLDYGVFPDRPYDSPGVWGDPTKINAILKDAGLA